MPGLRVTVHVVVVLPPTDVFLLTPGPKRWKLWIEDLSSTLIVYLPLASFFTALPAEVLRVIVKLGPHTHEFCRSLASQSAARGGERDSDERESDQEASRHGPLRIERFRLPSETLTEGRRGLVFDRQRSSERVRGLRLIRRHSGTLAQTSALFSAAPYFRCG